MSRSLNTIQDSILNTVDSSTELDALEVLTENEQSTLAELTSSSKVAVWRLFVWVIAFTIWVHEQLWDVFRADVERRIAETRVHNRAWYRGKALAFRFGQDLIPETDQYDDTGLEPSVIEASKIIKHAAVNKIVISGYGALKIKTAKDEGDNRVPLTTPELTAFNAYMNEIADAGTTILTASQPADNLKVDLIVYYDPLVLDTLGRRLDGTNDTPVIDEIKSHLRSIDFDGEFFPAELEKAIRNNVEGVNKRATSVRKSWSKFGSYNYTDTGVVNVGLIDEIRATESGYMTFDVENSF